MTVPELFTIGGAAFGLCILAVMALLPLLLDVACPRPSPDRR